jgi:hypothetical protein
MKTQVALVLGLTLSAVAVSFAQTEQEQQQACMNDAFQYCGHTIPDRNRTFECLVSNRNVISRPCHGMIVQYLPPEPVATKKKAAPKPKTKDAGTTKVVKDAKTTKRPVDLAPR